LPPAAAKGVHVCPDEQSASTAQTWNCVAPHELAQAVPVKPTAESYVQPGLTSIFVAFAQQTFQAPHTCGNVHSMASEFATGHAAPAAPHVDGVPADEGGSQHCCPCEK
jgi:hypothetical protein